MFCAVARRTAEKERILTFFQVSHVKERYLTKIAVFQNEDSIFFQEWMFKIDMRHLQFTDLLRETRSHGRYRRLT